MAIVRFDVYKGDYKTPLILHKPWKKHIQYRFINVYTGEDYPDEFESVESAVEFLMEAKVAGKINCVNVMYCYPEELKESIMQIVNKYD